MDQAIGWGKVTQWSLELETGNDFSFVLNMQRD